MKQLFSWFAAVLLWFHLLPVAVVQAQPLVSVGGTELLSISQMTLAQVAEPVQTLLTKLETEVLPQIKTILTPEQQEALKIDLTDGGMSFRKALKSLNVTPEQKTQLKALLKSLPKDDAFATLTPEERKQYFLKKKEYFMPTAEEISEKINSKMKLGQEQGGIPTVEEISAMISEKMKLIQSKMESMTSD